MVSHLEDNCTVGDAAVVEDAGQEVDSRAKRVWLCRPGTDIKLYQPVHALQPPADLKISLLPACKEWLLDCLINVLIHIFVSLEHCW